MFVIIGIAIVIIGVFGGFVIEKGNLSIIIQPVELLIIFGAAGGGMVIMEGAHAIEVIKKTLAIFTHKNMHKHDYKEILTFFYKLSQQARKEGLLSLEGHFENPEESEIFKSCPIILKNEKYLSFVSDNIKIAIAIRMEPKELEALIDLDIEARLEAEHHPHHVVAKVADSLPGLGIVAAVLGVIITMGAISEPPEVLGHHVSVALAGTFMGILCCYGFLGPMAHNMENIANENGRFYNIVKNCIPPFINGLNPIVVIEYGRKIVPYEERPTAAEIEEEGKGG